MLEYSKGVIAILYAGVDIGGTKCAVTTGDDSGKILSKVRFETLDVSKTLERILFEVKNLKNISAIGISCGGPLDSRRGVICSPPNLPGWDNIEICSMLQKECNVPVFLQNDANACALAEWHCGAGKGCENMIFLTFGTGLGAGLILNGRLYSGTNDMAGEIGHIRLSSFGPVGFGKSGSFEGFCSGGGIKQIGQKLAREKIQMGEKTLYCASLSELDSISAKSIAEAANQGDETAKRVYRICGEKLGEGLSILIDILNPEKIVIGSVYARSENLLCEGMQHVLKKEALRQSLKVCSVVPAKLMEEIGDYAALAVAKEGLKNAL